MYTLYDERTGPALDENRLLLAHPTPHPNQYSLYNIYIPKNVDYDSVTNEHVTIYEYI